MVTLGLYSPKIEIQKSIARAFDLRMTRMLPEKAYVGGINLAPGRYSFTITYYSGNTKVDTRRVENRQVAAGQLNLVEDFCLQYLDSAPGWGTPDFPGKLPAPANVNVQHGPQPFATDGRASIDSVKVQWDPVPDATMYIVTQKEGYPLAVTGNTETFADVFNTADFTLTITPVGNGGLGAPAQITWWPKN